ncbi:hypothetical protein SUDANB1_00449 [Streptomyces sp. enrichment culture]|uniref:hypothetical protein n=1 Tax=Streptomyces sp. enrichment culture TaxID=1795815 RepID=UPI003F565BF0
MPETPEPDEEPRWWSIGKQPAEEPHQQGSDPAPGVHVHITPPPPPPPVDTSTHDRRAHARRWFLVHGAAAGVGWTFGLYDSMAAFLNTLGPGGSAAGLALAGFGWFAAEVVGERYVRVLPSRVRPPVLWVLRIPMATALLATALHAPNALI